MSLAEDLLDTLNDGGASYSTESNDVEEPIIIDETRRIIVPNKLKTIAVTGDKDVETVTFKCVRYWDTVHDLSNFVIYINYILPNNATGTYIPEITGIFDDYFTFDWVIGRELTAYNGTLTFLILARKADDDGALRYQWSSLLNSECNISKGLDILNVPVVEGLEDRLTLLLQLPLERGTGANSVQMSGANNAAEGDYSVAYGEGLTTSRRGQAVFGRHNIPNATAVFQVGNGTSGAPQNAFEVLDDNTAKIGNNKVATEEYVQSYINETILGGEW